MIRVVTTHAKFNKPKGYLALLPLQNPIRSEGYRSQILFKRSRSSIIRKLEDNCYFVDVHTGGYTHR
ncbi:hypothetical protein MTR_1g086400 [Medicago truncatula]|uniref:Uncharacterized protein n=1 Tax=Medicago truncatula TaxID=3880 RepID=G7ICS5_MEDTR|nr:hypothetical protein MTR_1g086400 [Medicago truncatula]